MLLIRPFVELQSIFNILIPGTLVLVSVLVGLGIATFIAVREQRQTILSRFVYLQAEFQRYREAFYFLAQQLERRYGIDIQIDIQNKRKYEDLCKDTSFMQDVAKKPHVTIFVRALHDVGVHYWDVEDFETKGTLLVPAVLEMAGERLAHLSSTLSRRKYYENVFRELQVDPSDGFDSIYIADDSLRVKDLAEELPSVLGDNWRTLGFWENAINKAYEIVQKMLPMTDSLFYYKPRPIKVLMIEASVIAVFGVLIPLIGSVFQLPAEIGTSLILVSVIGFLISFTAIIVTIFRYISAKSILKPIINTRV